MPRAIKRYENRKLYDTAEKRYVSLEDIARLVRGGEEVQVIDNATGADHTAQTLAKIILEEDPASRQLLQPGLLHDLLRYGNRFVAGSREQLQEGLDRLVQASLERLGPVRQVREEMARVRERLERMERLIEDVTKEEQQHGDDPQRSDE